MKFACVLQYLFYVLFAGYGIGLGLERAGLGLGFGTAGECLPQ